MTDTKETAGGMTDTTGGKETTGGKAKELALSLQHSLFATRDSVEDAFDYAYSIIQTLPEQDRLAAYTALHVLVNTIAEEIKRVEV